jgi:hypothetical protein
VVVRTVICAELKEFLSAYFSDQSTEEGVREVVFVTAENPDYHRAYLATIDRAIEGAVDGDPSVAKAIEDSFAASARDPGEARAYLESLRGEYLRQYRAATTLPGEP